MNEKQRVCISGACGRMGALIIKLLPQFPEFQLSGALVAPGVPPCGLQCCDALSNYGTAVHYSGSVAEAMQGAQALIDFSAPEASLATLREAARLKIPALIGTTGHSPEQLAEIKCLATHCPVLLAPNTSAAVFVLHEAALLAQRLFGADFDVEIFEIHHKRKKDAPSGTALSLANALAAQGGLQLKTSREGIAEERTPTELGVTALRGGDVPGEHTVFFLGEDERLEITQRARDRSVFARGALRLMRRLRGKPAALYSVKDLYIQ